MSALNVLADSNLDKVPLFKTFDNETDNSLISLFAGAGGLDIGFHKLPENKPLRLQLPTR